MSKLLKAALLLALLFGASAAAKSQPAAVADPANPADTAPGPAAPAPAPAAQPAESAPGVAIAVRSKKPTFTAQTVATAELGLVGLMIARRDGNDLVEMNDMADPANAIGPDLAKAYAASVGATVVEKPLVLQGDDAKAALPDAKAQGLRYLVDVSTSDWGSRYFSFDWTHYGVSYGATLKVYDVATGKVIVSGRCQEQPHKSPDSPGGDAMLANRGAILKQMLADAAQRCAAKLKTETLKL
jgi:hypothetical protein